MGSTVSMDYTTDPVVGMCNAIYNNNDRDGVRSAIVTLMTAMKNHCDQRVEAAINNERKQRKQAIEAAINNERKQRNKAIAKERENIETQIEEAIMNSKIVPTSATVRLTVPSTVTDPNQLTKDGQPALGIKLMTKIT